MPYSVSVSNSNAWSWYPYEYINEDGNVVTENGIHLHLMDGPFDMAEFIAVNKIAPSDTITLVTTNPDYSQDDHCRPCWLSIIMYAGNGVTVLDDQTASWIATQDEEDAEEGLVRVEHCNRHQDVNREPVDFVPEYEGTYCVGDPADH